MVTGSRSCASPTTTEPRWATRHLPKDGTATGGRGDGRPTSWRHPTAQSWCPTIGPGESTSSGTWVDKRPRVPPLARPGQIRCPRSRTPPRSRLSLFQIVPRRSRPAATFPEIAIEADRVLQRRRAVVHVACNRNSMLGLSRVQALQQTVGQRPRRDPQARAGEPRGNPVQGAQTGTVLEQAAHPQAPCLGGRSFSNNRLWLSSTQKTYFWA